MLDLPHKLFHPKAELWDGRSESLVYVFGPAGDERLGKVVVRVNRKSQVRPTGKSHEDVTLNEVRTAGLVPAEALRDTTHDDLVFGDI